jgi:uncharacterized protein (TIGR03435 family)
MQLKSLARTIILFTTAIGAGLRAQNAIVPGERVEFEVASVKLNNSATESMRFPPPSNGQFAVANVSLKVLISYAFNVQGSDITGDPAWAASDRYDVTAKAAKPNLSLDQYRLMVQALLGERFKLAAHRETRERSGFVLVTAKGGPKLLEANSQSCVERGTPHDPAKPDAVTCGTFFTGTSSLDARKMSIAQFASTLSMVLGNPVLDKTGIAGFFDIHLEFNAEGTNLTGRGALPRDAAPDDARAQKPSLFTALNNQAGLRLESEKAPVTILVIDHLERMPSEN